MAIPALDVFGRSRPLLLVVLLVGWGVQSPATDSALSRRVDGEAGIGVDQGCGEDEYSAGIERIGVHRSTDGGATWARLGDACFHAPALVPVDPSPIAVDGGVALYFLDLLTLRPGLQRVIYRAETTDGLEFTQPTVAFTTDDFITDPYVLAMPGGYRMYLHSDHGILSAWSSDGLAFTAEAGVRTTAGGVPGATVLADDRVRLFVGGALGDQPGVFSLVSDDGLEFVLDPGLRLPWANGTLVANLHPVRLRSGRYLGSFNEIPGPSLEVQEAHMATSADAFTWIPSPTVVALGSMPGVVELEDGTLLLYYVDFNYDSCHPDSTTLCLNRWRFRAQAHWETAQGASGTASAVQMTDDTGYFWFFAGTNVEVVLKVLDACAEPFNRYWAFSSGLTNVAVEITVTDTDTDEVKVYSNPQGSTFQPVLDTDAFATCP